MAIKIMIKIKIIQQMMDINKNVTTTLMIEIIFAYK